MAHSEVEVSTSMSVLFLRARGNNHLSSQQHGDTAHCFQGTEVSHDWAFKGAFVWRFAGAGQPSLPPGFAFLGGGVFSHAKAQSCEISVPWNAVSIISMLSDERWL